MRVLVRPDPVDDTDTVTESGIVTALGVHKADQKVTRGTIVSVGQGEYSDGVLVSPFADPYDLRTDDRVVFGKYSGVEVEHDGETLLMLRVEEVLAVDE